MKTSGLTRLLLIVIVMLTSLPAFAQDTTVPPIVAVQDGRIVAGTPDTLQVIAEGGTDYGPITTSLDGRWIAYIERDAQYRPVLWLYDRTTGQTQQVADGLNSGMPFSFTADSTRLVYALEGADSAVADSYMLEVFAEDLPLSGNPFFIASVPFGVGCGGGSTIPADIRYNQETYSLGGNWLTLNLTSDGLLYSTNCSGVGVALLNRETGETTVFEDLSRVVLSPDETRIAAVPFALNDAPPMGVVLVDLATGERSTIIDNQTVDQVAWDLNGQALYVTVRAFDGLLPLSAEQQARINRVLGGESTFPRYWSTLQRVDLITDQLTDLYSQAGYAIGRVRAAEGGAVFSVIPNLDAWVYAITDQGFNPFGPGSEAASMGYASVTLYYAADDGTLAELGDGLGQAGTLRWLR